MTPTLILAIAAALFVAPSIYILTASMLSQQGSLGGAALPGTAEAVICGAGATSLLAPFAISRLLSSSEPATRLLLMLIATVAASVFGLVLSFTTGRLVSVWVLGVASMLAILGWSWAYRECFRANPLENIAPRYTTVLIVVGVVFLAFAAYRTVLWDRAVTSPVGLHPAGL